MLEKTKRIFKKFLDNPVSFILRQIYRIFFVAPFHFIVWAVNLFNAKPVLKSKEPDSFCFIITSVIYPQQGNIQYNSPRSIFNPEQRAQQTLRTIESIRAKVPNARIILVEGGLQENLPFELSKKVDQYIYVGGNKFVRFACDSKYKSLGESTMLLFAINKFAYSADFYFKISGRYYLDEEFDVEQWKHSLFVFQYIQEDYVCTRLYGFRAEGFHTWKYALIKGLPLALISYAVENILAKYIPKKQTYNLAKLGVMGIGGSDNVVAKD